VKYVMIDRREFIRGTAAAALADSPLAGFGEQALSLPVRPIPGTRDVLPVVGLGNSNAFRQGDLAVSKRIIATLTDHGGAYVDCGGGSRFVVAEAAAGLGVADQVFMGTYFSGADDRIARDEAARIVEQTGKPMLDLMHNYPEDAAPHWQVFRRWKDDGLTKYIGVSRHRKEAYPTMIEMMKSGTVDILQVNYSPLETEAEDEILPAAQELGVAVTVNRPFINGRYFSIVGDRPLPDWAADFDCRSWAQFSLKFILGHPAVTCVLTETTNPRHAVDNLGAGFGRLPDADTRLRMAKHLQAIAGGGA